MVMSRFGVLCSGPSPDYICNKIDLKSGWVVEVGPIDGTDTKKSHVRGYFRTPIRGID